MSSVTSIIKSVVQTIGGKPVATWEGAVFKLLDEMLATEQIEIEVRRADGTSAKALLDVTDKVTELTEPGQLFSGLGLETWSPPLDPVIGEVMPDGTAAQAGIQSGDILLRISGEPVAKWMDLVDFVQSRPGETIAVVIERDGVQQTLQLPVAAVDLGDGSQIGRIGAAPLVPEGKYDEYLAYQRYGALQALPVAFEKTWSMSVLTVKMVGSILLGDVSVKNISGPINIAQYAGYSASVGLASFLNFLAVVSLSLGILNLLPIPVLDGGQVVYQLLEGLKGSPLSMRTQLVGQQIGVVFLVLLMGFAFYNDLSSVFS